MAGTLSRGGRQSPANPDTAPQAWLTEMGGPLGNFLDIDVGHWHPCKELLLVILTDRRQVAVATAAATH